MTYNVKLRPMTAREWLKYHWRIELFSKKYRENEIFRLVNNDEMKFKFSQEILDKMISEEPSLINSIILEGEDGKEYRISDLGKSAEFGGKGSGSGTKKEDMELKSLQDQLEVIKKETGENQIKLFTGGTSHMVSNVVTTPGMPKSDFHFTCTQSQERVWVSHKDGKSPKDFQQWGGVSQKYEPKIHAHEEVQSFVSDLKKLYPNGLPNKTSLYRKIEDDNLKMMSVYGNGFGGVYSRQNVNVVVQGATKIAQSGDSFVLTGNTVHHNGEKVEGGYEPVLTAVYKGDRSDYGVKGTRIVCMPIEGRKMSGEI